MRIDHYYRRGYTEAQLLELLESLDSKVDGGKTVTSMSPHGLPLSFDVDATPEEMENAVMYALWRRWPETYSHMRPEPDTYRTIV